MNKKENSQLDDSEFEAKREEILLNQECLFVLSPIEKQWLIHLYDTDVWVSNQLNNIYNAKPEDKNLIIEELVSKLHNRTEQIVLDFISETYEASRNYKNLIIELRERPELNDLLMKASLAWIKNDLTDLEEIKRKLFAVVNDLDERAKELGSQIAAIIFKEQIISLPLNYKFILGSDLMSFLNQLVVIVGHEEVRKFLDEIVRKSDNKRKMKNLIERLKRALVY